MNFSALNLYSPSSTSSSEVLRQTGRRKEVTIGQNRKLVLELVNNIFDDMNGKYEMSSSHCSSVLHKSSEYSVDRRLRYWKDMVAERKRIAEYIKNKTGKFTDDVLFNQPTTVNDRDKQTVKRLIDYAERMNPLVLINKHEARLPEYIDESTCQHVNELIETLPLAERLGGKIVEISGLPCVAKEEQLGKSKKVQQRSHWLKSKVLEQRIEKKREDIERVIEYYPDIEHLQVVGESLTHPQLMQHDSKIMLLQEEYIKDISSDSSAMADECVSAIKVTTEDELVDYAIRINELEFKLQPNRSAKNVVLKVCFECEPFERAVRRVLRVENIGRKVLNFDWAARPYYGKTPLLVPTDNEFVFNDQPFRLISGESQELYIQYQPRRVQIVREKWLLKVNPAFFCRRQYAVVLLLTGRCLPAQDYMDKMNQVMGCVREKSNQTVMRTLTQGLAVLAPVIKPSEVVCPYSRALTEPEVFELYNVGFKCNRFHELELLRDIYRRVKKPREPAWDLRLETLKATILRVENAEQRASFFSEMVSVLEEMRGQPLELEQKVSNSFERDRTRLLFVRGIVATGIDEWEDMAVILEEAFIPPLLEEYNTEMKAAAELTDISEIKLKPVILDAEAVRQLIEKRVRHNKGFRDALYMQTYTHLCNFIEDIVSIIESTEII